ncbi:hypothetical protein IAR50_003211 [Cryptococcus sp. DSM 104548]
MSNTPRLTAEPGTATHATHPDGATSLGPGERLSVQASLLVKRCAVVPAREALAVAQQIEGDAWDVRIRNMGHLVDLSKVKVTLAKALDRLADLVTSPEYPGCDNRRDIQFQPRPSPPPSEEENLDSVTTTRSEVDDALDAPTKLSADPKMLPRLSLL